MLQQFLLLPLMPLPPQLIFCRFLLLLVSWAQ